MHSLHATSHTGKEWESIRPIFEYLYITEDRELKDVQAVLREQYGFSTTTKQCKTRLKQWRLRKNHGQEELLFVARKLLQRERDGRRATVRLRGTEMKFEENVMKHFRRKHRTEQEVRAQAEALTAPTPPDISCSTPSSELSISTPSSPEASEHETEAATISLILNRNTSNLTLYNKPAMTSLEIDFARLRQSLDATISSSYQSHSPLRIRCRYSGDVIASLNNAQLCLTAGRRTSGKQWYNLALDYVSKSLRAYDSDILQLVSFLLSRYSYETESRSALFVSLLCYLSELGNVCTISPLSVIASGLLRDIRGAEHASLAFQKFMTNYMTEVLGKDSIVALWLNIRVCRQMHARRETEAGKELLQHCLNTFNALSRSLDPLVFTELGRELSISMHVIMGLHHAKRLLAYILNSVSDSDADLELQHNRSYCRLRLAFCNMHLKLYAEAMKDACLAMTFFTQHCGLTDYRTYSARYLINDIFVRATTEHPKIPSKQDSYEQSPGSGGLYERPGNLFGYYVTEVSMFDGMGWPSEPTISPYEQNVVCKSIPDVWNQDPTLDLSYIYRESAYPNFEQFQNTSTWSEGYSCEPDMLKDPLPWFWQGDGQSATTLSEDMTYEDLIWSNMVNRVSARF